jgi:Glycosyltransferase family 28 C-terminal domain
MIGWYVHHHGAGHLQQLRTISNHLVSPVTAFSSLKRPTWWRGEWIELPSDAPADRSADATAGGVLHWVPRHHPGLRQRGAAIAAWIDQARPRLFVTDVSVEVTLLARLLGVPVAVVAMRGSRTDRAHAAAYDLADALLAPWPAALASTSWPARWLAKTWHVGAFSAFDGCSPCRPPETSPRRVLVVMGSGGAKVTPATLARARSVTPGWEWQAAGVTSRLPRPALWRALCQAHIVITHAGQNAVAEVAAARRPAIVVAQPRPHDEQADTAQTLQRAGIAMGLTSWPAASRLPGLLDAAAKQDAERWGEWSPGDGALRAAREIDHLARRFQFGAVCGQP